MCPRKDEGVDIHGAKDGSYICKSLDGMRVRGSQLFKWRKYSSVSLHGRRVNSLPLAMAVRRRHPTQGRSSYELITSPRPHLKTPAHLGFSFNVWIWVEHKHANLTIICLVTSIIIFSLEEEGKKRIKEKWSNLLTVYQKVRIWQWTQRWSTVNIYWTQEGCQSQSKKGFLWGGWVRGGINFKLHN